VPDEGTLDLALMFVPSESVYYEMLMTSDSKGEPLDSYCRGKGIVAVSPNTLYAHLCVIHLGLRGMQIEENAMRISAGLSGIQKNMSAFTDIFEKLGTHLKNAQQSYADADKKLERTQSTMDTLIGASAADAALENRQRTLALTLDTDAKVDR
jgi:DNA recombination protein RmuC